jgi:hypothetical protein
MGEGAGGGERLYGPLTLALSPKGRGEITLGGDRHENFEYAAHGAVYRLSLLFPGLCPLGVQAPFLGHGGNTNSFDGRSIHWFRGQALPGLRSGALCPRLPHGGLFAAKRGRRGGQEKAVHSLRRVRQSVPGRRHLPGPFRRTLRLHSLRPLRGILSS